MIDQRNSGSESPGLGILIDGLSAVSRILKNAEPTWHIVIGILPNSQSDSPIQVEETERPRQVIVGQVLSQVLKPESRQIRAGIQKTGPLHRWKIRSSSDILFTRC